MLQEKLFPSLFFFIIYLFQMAESLYTSTWDIERRHCGTPGQRKLCPHSCPRNPLFLGYFSHFSAPVALLWAGFVSRTNTTPAVNPGHSPGWRGELWDNKRLCLLFLKVFQTSDQTQIRPRARFRAAASLVQNVLLVPGCQPSLPFP